MIGGLNWTTLLGLVSEDEKFEVGFWDLGLGRAEKTEGGFGVVLESSSGKREEDEEDEDLGFGRDEKEGKESGLGGGD